MRFRGIIAGLLLMPCAAACTSHTHTTTAAAPSPAVSPAASPARCITDPRHFEPHCPPGDEREENGVRTWGFSGDEAVRDKLESKAETAYRQYRSDARQALDTSATFDELYAAPVRTGDVVVFLSSEPHRAERAATVYFSSGEPGGVRVLADQPIGATTDLLDALIPATPTDLVLALIGPGTAVIHYTVDTRDRAEPTTDGVAIFNRAPMPNGASDDSIHRAGQGFTEPARTPGLFSVDGSQPGRLSDPEAALAWVFAAWDAGDQDTAALHADPAGVKALFAHSVPGLVFKQCTRTSPIGQNVEEACTYVDGYAHSGSTATYTFDVGGGPSLGYQLYGLQWPSSNPN